MVKPLHSRYKHIKILILFIGLFGVSFNVFGQFYNGLQTSFGKNRIQYDNERTWSYFRYKKYDVYFYQGGLSLAVYSTTYINKEIKKMSKILDYDLQKKIRFIFFNDLSDLKETNIGLITDEQYNTGGVIHVVDNKVFISFNGNHQDLEREIREGIAQVMINELMYGGGAGSSIKNSILLSFPSWYIDGLVSYLADDWNTDVDNVVRDGILSGRYKKFYRLSREQQHYVGHSIWHYIDQRFGKQAVGEVLYMAKVNRSVESGFLYILGMSYKMLLKDWYDWYLKRYESEIGDDYDMPEKSILKKKRNKSKRVYSRATLSPDGRYVAYVRNEIGKVKVRVLDLEKGRRKTVMKFGYKLDEKTDYSYPLITWSPIDNSLTLIHERKGDNELIIYNEKRRKRLKRYLMQFDKVLDLSYNNRGNLLVLSAIKNGQSDIYIYNIGSNTFKRITNDVYDDEHPRFANNSTAIIFSSNRPDDIIRFDKKTNKNVIIDTLKGMPNMDLFFYEIKPKNMKLRRVTNTPMFNEIYPMPIKYNHFSWLSNENGIYNRYVGYFDSTISFIDTTTHYRYYTKYHAASNYPYNILEQDYNPVAGKYTEMIYSKGHYRMYVADLPDFEDYNDYDLSTTAYMSEVLYKEKQRRKRIEYEHRRALMLKNDTAGTLIDSSTIEKKKEVKKKRFRVIYLSKSGKQTTSDKSAIDINNYTFSGEDKNKASGNAGEKTEGEKVGTQQMNLKAKTNIDIFKPKLYYVEYSISTMVTQMDFSYLDYSYQPFTNPRSPIYINPGFNAFIKLGVADLFEDYHLTGGVRLSANLKNNEYFASFKNLKKRLDKELIFHRKVLNEYQQDYGVKHQIEEGILNLTWPFDQVKSIRGSIFLRYDNAAYRATISPTATLALKTPNMITYNAGLRLSYVFDNTRSPGLNLFYGTRYKLFAEYYQPITDLDNNMFVVGLDFRKYIKLFRSFIWANRLAASTSFGTQRLAYYLGSVDNWMFPKFNNYMQVDQTQNFQYQTLATNMRGFNQNIRNGNSFVVINSELRMPVFKIISNKPLKSQFLRNFMVVGFFDVGTAWSGPNPFSDNNALFRQEIYSYPIKVVIINQNDPIVAGYGFGLRSKLFGYYVRADWAWGIENGYIHKKSIFYLSLSLDF